MKEVYGLNGLAYVMVVLGILLAKGIGFLRDIVFASIFGASVYTDMYFQIFGLVNLIFTGVGVALSTLVIKNLNKEENLTLLCPNCHSLTPTYRGANKGNGKRDIKWVARKGSTNVEDN